MEPIDTNTNTSSSPQTQVESRHSIAAIQERARAAAKAAQLLEKEHTNQDAPSHIPTSNPSANGHTHHPPPPSKLTAPPTPAQFTPSSPPSSTFASPVSGSGGSVLLSHSQSQNDVAFPSSLTESYLTLPDPAALVSTLPNSNSFDDGFDTMKTSPMGSDDLPRPPTQPSAAATSRPPTHQPHQPVLEPRFRPVDDDSDEFITPTPPFLNAQSDSNLLSKPKKESTSTRLKNFFSRDKGKPKSSSPPRTDSASAPTSSSSSLLNLLRSTSNGSSSEKKRKQVKKDQEKAQKARIKAEEAAAKQRAKQEADEQAEMDDAASSTGSGQKRSVYTQKLIHLSNTFLNMFSGSSSGQPSSLLAFSQTQHTFTNSPAWILGRCYKLLGPPPVMHHADVAASVSVQAAQLSSLALRRARFLSDFTSQIWCTYRRGFPHISNSVYTSDAGWGCMIRSAQMMLANVFVRHFLGREWRRPEKIKPGSSVTGTHGVGASASAAPSTSTGLDDDDLDVDRSIDSLPPLHPAYLRILTLFLDSPSSSSPYSIHNLLHHGQSSKDKKVGEWFGPHASCWMIKMCMEGELAKLQARLANGTGHDEFERQGFTQVEDGFGSEDIDRHTQRQQDASSSPVSPPAASVPPQYAVPKIYVSDDGTLYLDKIMSLVKVEKPAVTTSTTDGMDSSGVFGTDESKLDAESIPGSRSASGSFSAGVPSSIPHPPQFSTEFHPLMILIPLRLGIDKLNPSYVPSLLSLFQFPQCIGIIGGKPRTSFYFIGVQDDHLFYLDPHTVQKAADLTGAHSLRGNLAMKHEIADSYHCSNVLSIRVQDIDPSLAIGFYIENQSAMDDFWEQAKQLTDATLLQQHAASAGLMRSPSSSSGSHSPGSTPSPPPVLHPVFHVADVSPNYDCFDDSDGTGSDEGDESDATSEADFEQARQHSQAEEDDEPEDSPVAVNTANLPKDANGRPLNLDSLTNSPVICPAAPAAANDPDSLPPEALGDSVVDVDGSLLADAPTDETGSTNRTASVASSSVAALTDLTYAFSTAAASRISSSAKVLSDYATSAAIQAQDGLSHLAAQAAHLQQQGLRKMSREPPQPQSMHIDASGAMNSPVAAPSSAPNATTGSAVRPVIATSSPGPSVCSTSSKPASLRKGSSKSARSRTARRGSKGEARGGDLDDDWNFL